MIQHAFKSAYTNEVQQRNQGINTITKGVESTIMLAVGIAGMAGALGSAAVSSMAKHALMGRIGGVGGNIMLAAMEQKKASALQQASIFGSKDYNKVSAAFDNAADTIDATAKGADKIGQLEALDTVWGKIQAKRNMDEATRKLEEAFRGGNNA